MFARRPRLTGTRSTPTIGSMASRSRRWLFLLMAAVLLVGSGAVTTAHHGGRAIGSLFNCDRPGVFPPRCTSVAGDLRHRVFFDATLTDGLASSLRDAMAEDYDPTDLVVTQVDELTPATDVVAHSRDYGDVGAAAWVYCPTDAPQGLNSEGDRWCRMQEIHFNLNARYAVFFEDDGSRDHVACHEFGHTVGLRHWGNPPDSVGPPAATCMNANTPNGPTELHQIDIDHINAYHYVAPPPSRRMKLVSQPSDRMGPLADAGVEALESERYASLHTLTRATDAVVRGTVISIEPGRAFGDPGGVPLHYAGATIRVGEVVAGGLVPEDAVELTLEIPLFDGIDSIGSIESSLLGAEGAFFLRSKVESARAAGLPVAEQRAESGYYRLVVFGAVIGNDSGAAGPGDDESGVLAQLDGLSFAQALGRIRQASR
jgi:hypothetical protein